MASTKAKTSAKPENKNKQPVAATASHSAYDEVAYVSYPFPQTNPLLLQGIAKLFGLNVALPDKARILEIGCASGSNIMSIASLYPGSKCVGIDYSARQIEVGNQIVAAAGITNLELRHMSVMDVTSDFGTFDYIICHGVLSWVPPEVQDKIIEVCKTNLAPDGVAYISYNTLPGWNNVRSVRDMMLYHTARFEDPATKAQQARLLLGFVVKGLRENQNPIADVIDREIELLSRHPDSYLLHDHMEENNIPLYFHEFMDRAERNNLQYLGDTTIETMFTGNLSADIVEVLSTSDDIVRTEQYMDFISNRRFRSTLLCHADRILNRNVQPGVLQGAYMVSRFSYPEGFEKHDINSRVALQFRGSGAMTLTADDPIVLAMLQAFQSAKSVPMTLPELTRLVRKKLADAKCRLEPALDAALEEALALYVLRYIFIGGIVTFSQNLPFVATVSEKPALSKLTRYQSTTQGWIANQRQEFINISPLDKVLMRYIDGTHDVEALCDLLMPHFESKELVINEKDVEIQDMKAIRKKAPDFVRSALKMYADNALLVA